MRRPRMVRALAAVLASVLVLASCSSDPTNPAASTNQAASSNPAATTPADESAATGAPGASGSSGSATAAGSSGASTSGAGTSGGVEGAPTGEPAEPGQAAAGATGTLNILMYQKPNGIFNPIGPASGPDNQVISLIYEPLIDISGSSGSLVPVLAEALPESDDGVTYTVKLKEGITWSDGTPLTSKDVLTTLQLAANPTMEKGGFVTFAQVAGYQELLDGTAKTLTGITAPDESTIQIKLSSPSAGSVDKILLTRIMPDHVVNGFDVKTFTDNPYFRAPKVGTGPFSFDNYQTDQFVKMVPNPNFRFKVGAKEVFLKILTSDVATSQLQTGELDVTMIAPVDLETVQGFPGVTVTPIETPGFVRFAWNQDQERFKDPKVKQAFLYAINRKSIVDGALKGQAVVRNSVLGPPWQAPDLNQYDYDPAKAKQLFTEANYDLTEEVQISWIPGGNPDRDAAAQIVQDQLKEVGVNATLNQVQGTWFTDNVSKGPNFDIAIYGGGNYTANPYEAIPIVACQPGAGKGPNNGLYCNKEFEAALKKADAIPDPEARKAAYQEASKMENEDPSQMWMYSLNLLWAISAKVQGYTADPGLNYFEAWKWTKTG